MSLCIKVEGSGELPILDGSAYAFTYEAARVGLVPAENTAGGEGTTPRMAWKPAEGLMVTEAGPHQGLKLVHFSAQLERFVWHRGCA